MAQSINVNFRMDEDLKKNMEKICDEMGLTLTTAFTIFAKTVTRERRIPFEVTADPFYAASNMQALSDSLKQLQNGDVIIKTIEDLEAMTNE
ncbi:MAG: type II toxin-antitoxin system RelB/DinJ family antitoxin [Ruminococcus sp.]|nr:type II toxin-antitoxin system RelB/DinJ family antitoxin [Ruminococcus sp.]